MSISIMWQDEIERPLAERLKTAVAHCQAAHNFTPARAEVHRSLADDDVVVGGVLVRPSAFIAYPSLMFLVMPEEEGEHV